MLKLLLLLSVAFVNTALAASAGCNKAPTLTSGRKTITVNGRSREYTLKVPDNYDNKKPYRVIFGLHWRGGSMNDVVNNNYYGLLPLSQNSAIFVSPNGFNNGWANSNGEDIAFIDALVKTIDQGLCVDEKLRFATGFSWGGGMSYSIACSRAKDFRAIAPIAGGLISGCAGGTDPVAYLGFHGVSDNVLPISQGRSLRDTFLRNNKCQAKNAPEPSPGSRQVIKTEYSCAAGFPVTFIAFDGGHVSDPRNGQNQLIGPGETWAFFSQFTGGGGTTNPPVSTVIPEPTPTPQPTNTPGNCAALYGQCGGQGYNGPKCCQTGTCKFSNDWYSQCL